MFTTRFALLTLVTAAVVSVALVLLLDATPVIATPGRGPGWPPPRRGGR